MSKPLVRMFIEYLFINVFYVQLSQCTTFSNVQFLKACNVKIFSLIYKSKTDAETALLSWYFMIKLFLLPVPNLTKT